MADYASPARNEGKFSAPYEYCGWIVGLRLNRSLTVFLNPRATNQIYICPRWRGRPLVGRRQEFAMRRLITEFLKDEAGATAIEYCLIAAGISIVIVVAVNGIGTGLNDKFTSVNTSIK
jgi:pilus assembly protein Flp/PilA